MNIDVQEQQKTNDIFQFVVCIGEDGKDAKYDVTIDKEYWKKLTNERVDAETLAKDTFEFLLEREPKEAILPFFDLSVVKTYFPEYESEMGERYADR